MNVLETHHALFVCLDELDEARTFILPTFSKPSLKTQLIRLDIHVGSSPAVVWMIEVNAN